MVKNKNNRLVFRFFLHIFFIKLKKEKKYEKKKIKPDNS